MKRLFLASAVAILGFASASWAQNVTSSTIRHGGWAISSHRNQASGQFSHCTAGVSYNSGIFLIFSINNRMVWNVGFVNSAWTLNQGGTINLQYYVDNNPPRSGVALYHPLIMVEQTTR